MKQINQHYAEIFLAWRYLRPVRNVLSFITCMSIVGVMLGVAVLIVVLAVMTGFTNEMKMKMCETMAHIQIHDYRNGFIAKPEAISEKVNAMGGYESAPVVMRSGLLQKDGRLVPKQIVGIIPELSKSCIPVEKYRVFGKFSLDHGEMLVGDYTARELGVGVGDKVIIHSPEKITRMVNYDDKGKIALNENMRVYLPDEFTVTGIFKMGKYDFDSSVLFVNLDDADELFGLPMGAATAVYVMTKDPFGVKKDTRSISAELPGFQVYSWMDLNSDFLGVLAVEKNMMFFLLIFIIVVAAFSISNTLIIKVFQKIREIGLLKALGADSGFVMRVFVIQGVFVGITGTITGSALGLLIIRFRNELLFLLRKVSGIEIFPAKYYFFSELPAKVIPFDLALICISSVILCTVVAVIPSLIAAYFDPAKALRYE